MPDERQEQETILETYMQALGCCESLPVVPARAGTTDRLICGSRLTATTRVRNDESRGGLEGDRRAGEPVADHAEMGIVGEKSWRRRSPVLTKRTRITVMSLIAEKGRRERGAGVGRDNHRTHPGVAGSAWRRWCAPAWRTVFSVFAPGIGARAARGAGALAATIWAIERVAAGA